MGLKKAKQVNSAIVADYWRIVSVNYDEKTKLLLVRFGLFINKLSSDNGDEPVREENLFFENIEKDSDMSFEFIYQKAKTDPSIMSVLVSEEVPEVTNVDENGEEYIVTPMIPAVYKSFFDDAEDE